MSEEANKKSDIPKGMIGSAGLAMIFYVLIAISVISLFGVNKASNQYHLLLMHLVFALVIMHNIL